MEFIIEQLLTSNTNAIQQATAEFNKTMQQNPNQAILDLYKILSSHEMPAVRQYAALLLRIQVRKRQNYERRISSDIKNFLKTNTINIIFQEKEKLVCGSIINFFGCILRHESRRHNDLWIDKIMQHILSQCRTNNQEINEVGCFVLAKLAEDMPAPLVKHFLIIGQLIKASLQAPENITLTMLFNILTTMDAMLPVINGIREAERIYEAVVPILIKIINKFASETLIEHFNIALEVLEDMCEYTPSLLKPYFPLLLEFLLGLGINQNHNKDIRIKALNFVSQLVREKKKLLIKLKLIEPIIIVIFNIMSTEPENCDPYEFFDRNDTKDSDTTLEAANIVMDTMAICMPTEKFLPPLLTLIEPALKNTEDILRRRAAYIVLSTISEGCHETICNKYLEPMINILKHGLNDPTSSVRNAALLAVGQFSEQLQPKIAKYGKDIVPILLKYMEDILLAYENGQEKIQEKHVERVFYALETFCDSMEKNLAPFMENLMTIIFKCLDNNNNNLPKQLQISAMALLESIAKAYKGSLIPWFQLLIEKLKPIIMSINNEQKNDKDDQCALSIVILAALARNINKQFYPYAKETIQQCLQWFQSNNNPDIQCGLLDLLGAISSINGEELKKELPTILKYIEISMDENLFGNKIDEADIFTFNDVNKMEVDITTSEEEKSTSEEEETTSLESHYLGENPYLQLKEQAIYSLKEIIEYCPQAMLEYYEKFFNLLYKNIQHDSIEVCIASITASKTLVIKWFEQLLNLNSTLNIKQNINILIKKLLNIINKDKSSDVVIRSLESIGEIIEISLPTKELCDLIAQSIQAGLNYKYKCQYCDGDGDNDDNDIGVGAGAGNLDGDTTENQIIYNVIDKAIIEAAADLIVSLSKVISKAEYLVYFKILEPLILKHIQNSTIGDLQSTRAILIGILAESYQSLDIYVKLYFENHLNLLLNAVKDPNEDIRQNAIFGLGELVRAGQNFSYDYFPVILKTLSEIIAYEKKTIVIEHIVGTLARLILTNYNLVPLNQVLPVIFNKLPIDNEIENNVVKESFEMLKNIMPERMNQYILNVFHKKKS